MRDLPLNALRAFAAVYSRGGVRAAARELRIAHSSVSRHLRELESWLGVTLTHPAGGRRGVAFTPQGEALGSATVGALREIGHAVAALREARSASSVSILAPASFAVRWLMPRLPAFETSHPGLEVSVIVDRGIDRLEDGAADLAIGMGPGPFRGVRSEPLAGDALYPVMSQAFWEKAGRPSRPAQLAGLRLLHDRDPQASWEAWREVHGPRAMDLQRGPRFTSTDLVLRAAAQGQGVALARHRLAVQDLETGLLCRPLGELAVELELSYWILLPRHLSPRSATRTVIGWLRREAARQPSR